MKVPDSKSQYIAIFSVKINAVAWFTNTNKKNPSKNKYLLMRKHNSNPIKMLLVLLIKIIQEKITILCNLHYLFLRMN